MPGHNVRLTKLEVNKMSYDWFLPVNWLLAIGADGCFIIMADTHLMRRAAHLQTGVLGGI